MILYLQDDGGTIIFGIDESKNFEIVAFMILMIFKKS